MPTLWTVYGRDGRYGCGKKKDWRLQTGDEDHEGECDVEGEGMRGVEGAVSAERKPPTGTAVPELCLTFSQIALKLVNKRIRNEAEDILQPAPEASFDAWELRRHMKGADISKRRLEDSTEKALAAERFTKRIVRTES